MRSAKAVGCWLLLAAVACFDRESVEQAAKDCGVPTPPVLREDGIGFFRVGTPAESVHRYCHVLSDTTLQPGQEGMPERRITVVLGPVAAAATVSAGHVWRIEIASPRFRTADSLGVGSSLGELRRAPVSLAVGEGAVFVRRPDHCGLSFQLGGARTTAPNRMAEIPDSTRVTMVLVVGCT